MRRQLYTVLKCIRLNSSSGFNGFESKAAGKSSRLFSRKVLVGDRYSKFSSKGISLLPLPVESLDCSPTPPSILCAHLKLELLQVSLHAVAPAEPQSGPAGLTFMHFLPDDWCFWRFCCYGWLPPHCSTCLLPWLLILSPQSL